MGLPGNGRLRRRRLLSPQGGVRAALGSPLGRHGLQPFQHRGRSLKDRRRPYYFSVSGFGIAYTIACFRKKVKQNKKRCRATALTFHSAEKYEKQVAITAKNQYLHCPTARRGHSLALQWCGANQKTVGANLIWYLHFSHFPPES